MKTALARKRPAAMYRGRDLDIARMIPVRMGAVMPAKRDRADAMPVALPRYATGKSRGV